MNRADSTVTVAPGPPPRGGGTELVIALVLVAALAFALVTGEAEPLLEAIGVAGEHAAQDAPPAPTPELVPTDGGTP